MCHMDKMQMALADASSVLTEVGYTYGVTWGVDNRILALDTKFGMGVPNHETRQHEKLSTCSRCKSVMYCCRECQMQHFEDHKLVCKRIAAKKNLVLVD
mmetsp:Transcript_6498/g.11288  ORF Transcript_6498/g.11288 Transcript_6498/m.11288 type:complete len:99 (-) Transcript_6498:332-628(-)